MLSRVHWLKFKRCTKERGDAAREEEGPSAADRDRNGLQEEESNKEEGLSSGRSDEHMILLLEHI